MKTNQPTINRGDIMRRIAALHVKATAAHTPAERDELKRQIEALTRQMMAP